MTHHWPTLTAEEKARVFCRAFEIEAQIVNYPNKGSRAEYPRLTLDLLVETFIKSGLPFFIRLQNEDGKTLQDFIDMIAVQAIEQKPHGFIQPSK